MTANVQMCRASVRIDLVCEPAYPQLKGCRSLVSGVYETEVVATPSQMHGYRADMDVLFCRSC